MVAQAAQAARAELAAPRDRSHLEALIRTPYVSTARFGKEGVCSGSYRPCIVTKRAKSYKVFGSLNPQFAAAGHPGAAGALNWLEEERQRRKEMGTKLLPRGKLATLPKALESFGEVLARIVDEIRVHGSEPVFMTQAVQTLQQSHEVRVVRFSAFWPTSVGSFQA
jgi:hypothetical protein